MKIAVLISGSPRFNKDFDTFVNGISNSYQVDWFVHLWKQNPPPDKLGYENYILVADPWRTVNRDWAISRLSSALPGNHKLINLEIYDNSLINYPEITGPQMHHINFQSIWKMHLGWKCVDTLRQTHHEKYDLVIRARPDLYLQRSLELDHIKNIINQAPETVLVPNGAQHGHGYCINDIMAISSPENISIYTDLVSQSIEYNRKGIMFHPETILAYHLIENKLKISPFIDTGIRSNMIKIHDNQFTVEFGQWSVR